MLDELHVRDVALIEDASLVFSPQLTVLTGETGAGKTALLTALGLIRGERAAAASVRDGAGEAVVEARLVSGADERVVRRRLSAKGRSRCAVDGQMATVAELAQACEGVRVHGQNEQSRLVNPAVQLEFLDNWISADGAHVRAYRQALEAHRAARQALEAHERAQRAAARELEFMRFTAAEIEKVKPQEGEYEQLEGELPRLQNAEQLAVAVDAALQALGNDGAVLDMLAAATRGLEREAGIDDELDALHERLVELQSQLEDYTRDLRSYAEGVVFDPRALEQTLSRLDALSGLMKRFGPGMDEVFATWRQAQEAIAGAESSPERAAQLQAQAKRAEEALRAAAAGLSEQRRAAAQRFCAQLAETVEELAMKGASFEFSFEELPFGRWGEAGSEHVELLYRPAPASSARPLARIASGGELSRISLALECMGRAASGGSEGETLVFDEIDQGVGGATGSAVARRLAQLSRHVQVVVVTHLAQVAALADAHYVVVKEQDGEGRPHTRVEEVEGEARVAELARMLAGTEDATALDHARSLLAGA